MFGDIASEMLYPVIPVYLKEIGFSVLLIGILEGFAEFTVGLSKGYFGKLSDERGQRLPFVKLGYFFSAISKPMMALFVYPMWIFLARTTDRLGKGLRTAARDALLSGNATKETKARIFGFHRAWDTFGAVVGPLFALGFLYYHPSQYKLLFFIAFLPGIVAVLLIFLLTEKKQPAATIAQQNFFSFFSYWKIAPPDYKKLVIGLIIFALANSSDVFLLLKAKEITGSDTEVIAAYIFYNLVYALSSYPMGHVADKFGFKKVFLSGLLLFAVVYTGFALNSSTLGIYILFFIYGLYASATEGIAKAWISNMAHEKNTATALGFYTSCQSIVTLLASVTAGIIWSRLGSSTVFLFAVSLTLIVIFYLSTANRNKKMFLSSKIK